MTPDKVEAALGVLRAVANVRKWWLTPWQDGGGNDSPKSALSNFTEASNGIDEALSVLTEALAERERDAARLDYIERTFSGMTNRERYLPVQMIWGNGCNGRTLREACDKYMKRDAAMKETP